MSEKRKSLRDIAERLGISISTVSLALRNDPRVAQKRKEQVQEVAKEIGYVPDPMLSSLIAYRKGKQENPVAATLAWINRWAKPGDLRRVREFDDYWRGAKETATKLGYRLEEFVINDTLKGPRLNEILLSRGVRGILLPPHDKDMSWRDLGIEWERFNVVRFGYSISDLDLHMVGGDQMRGAEMVVGKVAESGRRRLGLVSHKGFELGTRGNFRMGYTFGVDVNPEMAKIEPFMLAKDAGRNGELEPQDEAAFAAWLKENRVDSILTTETNVRCWLEKLGVRVPEEVALVATSVHESPDVSAGLDQNAEEIGKVAVQVLVGGIHRNELGRPTHCRRILVNGSWVDGDTLPFGD